MNNSSKIFKAIKHFFDNYLVSRDLEKTLECVADDLTSIGTGDKEIACGKEAFKELLQKEFAAIPNALPYKFEDFHEKKIAEDTYLILSNLDVALKVERSVAVTCKMRLTSVVQIKNDKVVITSLHASVASQNQQEGEFFPVHFSMEGLKNINLQTKHNLLEIAAELMPGGIIGVYQQAGFPFYVANTTFYHMLGYEDENDYVKSVNGLYVNSIYEEDREYAERLINEQLEKEDSYSVEYRILKKDGSFLYINDLGRKTKTDTGEDALICVIIDISSRVMQTQNLIKEANQDFLTGILNRKSGQSKMEELLHNTTNNLFLMIDLDNFKQVNDIYGHDQGDLVLRWIAALMANTFINEIVFRLGGDEFGIFISNIKYKHQMNDYKFRLNKIMEQYKAKIEQDYPESKSTISIGGIYKKTSCTFNDLYKLADETLYDIKKREKGKITIITIK